MGATGFWTAHLRFSRPASWTRLSGDAVSCAAGIMLALCASNPVLAQLATPGTLRGTSGGAADLATPAVSPEGEASRAVQGTPNGSQLGVSPFTRPANYGKARKKPKYPFRNPPTQKIARPLPLLETYPTAPLPLGQKRSTRPRLAAPDQPIPGPTLATIPALERRTRPRADANPFAPVGIGVGALRLFPYVDGLLGYDSNPNRANAGVKGSAFARAEAGLGVQSDWSRHELRGTLKAGYSDFFHTANASRFDAAASLSERVDVTRDTTLNFEQRYTYDTLNAGSPVLPIMGAGVTTVGRPVVQTFGAAAGATQKFNRLSLSLRGAVDRTAYGDSNLSDGTVSKLSADSFNDYTLRARASYEVTPGVSPFAEVTGSIRKHDQRLDTSASQFARNSRGLSAVAGTSIEFSRLLTGEASVGYGTRHYEDSRLADLRGLITDAALVWTPTPLTTIKLKAGTSLAETNTSGASGALVRSLGVELSHALWRNLTLGATLNYTHTDYQGIKQTDQTLSAGLKAEYSITRSIVLRSGFTHERLKSTAPGTDYTANVFLLGLRFQQ